MATTLIEKRVAHTDDAVRVLTEILHQVRGGFHPPRALSPQAEAAVALYNDLRRTLDHDTVRSACTDLK